MTDQLNLTDTEIADITHAVRPATQLRRLRQMGFHALARPDGRPLVSRDHYLATMAGARSTSAKPNIKPDFDALP